MQIQIDNNYQDKVLFIRFKNNRASSCKEDDLLININGVSNKLTCKSWKYHNQNYIFDYTFVNTNILNVTFNEGSYELSDFEIYILDFEEVKKIYKTLDPFVIKEVKNDKIKGKIDVKQDGYFLIQIPYDKGFEINVDGKLTKYQKVNEGFIGFKINKGSHNIIIEYKAPYKTLGLIISIFGVLLLVSISIFDYIKQIKK